MNRSRTERKNRIVVKMNSVLVDFFETESFSPCNYITFVLKEICNINRVTISLAKLQQLLRWAKCSKSLLLM